MKRSQPPPGDEATDAASEMSFPASDPPSYRQPTLGNGDRGTGEEESPQRGPSGPPTAEGSERETKVRRQASRTGDGSTT